MDLHCIFEILKRTINQGLYITDVQTIQEPKLPKEINQFKLFGKYYEYKFVVWFVS